MGPAADFISDILAASERSDPVQVREHLSRAQAALGLGACLDDVLLPAMHQIGLWWQIGRCDVDQEHLTTEAARAWLETLTAYAPSPARPAPIVLASRSGTTVFYAGNAFTSPRSRRALPGTYLGTRLQDACRIIHTQLEQPPPGRTTVASPSAKKTETV